jgi:hypothetical protein
MKRTLRLMLVTGTIALSSWLLLSPTRARAQAVGNDAVYNSTNGVTSSTSFVGRRRPKKSNNLDRGV